MDRQSNVLEQVEFETDVTAAEYRRFIESPVWRDFEAVLYGQVAAAQVALNTEDEPRELYRRQGMIEALNIVLRLPMTILDDLEQNKKEE